MWLWFAISALPFCLSVHHSPIFRRRIHSDLERPFCNGEAKVPSDEGNAALMRQFSELKGSAMVSQDALQTEALNCIDNFDEKDCDSTFALNYTKTTNIKVAASAASHYGERLKKSSGTFGCSCIEYYVDGPKLENEFFVGTMYCVFASKSSQEHAEKFISVKVGSTFAIWDVNNGTKALFLSTGRTDTKSPKLEKEEEDYWLGNKAKDLLIKELKTQKRFARFEWVKSTDEAMFSELLSEYIYTPEMAVDKILENCAPYIVYNLQRIEMVRSVDDTTATA